MYEGRDKDVVADEFVADVKELTKLFGAFADKWGELDKVFKQEFNQEQFARMNAAVDEFEKVIG